jgi:hypothetical protein
MSSAPPENMLSDEDDDVNAVDCGATARVIERDGEVVVNAYVLEMAAAQAAMVRADVFMIIELLLCRK